MSTAEPETVLGQKDYRGNVFCRSRLRKERLAMEESKDITSDCRPEELPDEEGEVTHPIRIICSRKSAPINSRVSRLKKTEESAPRTPGWTEIGDPSE